MKFEDTLYEKPFLKGIPNSQPILWVLFCDSSQTLKSQKCDHLMTKISFMTEKASWNICDWKIHFFLMALNYWSKSLFVKFFSLHTYKISQPEEEEGLIKAMQESGLFINAVI